MNHLKIFFTGLSYDWNEFKPVGRRPNCPCSTCRFTTWVYSGFHGRFHWNICSKFLLLQLVLAQLSLSLVIIDTFVPKLSLSIRSKKKTSSFTVLKCPLYRFWFQYTIQSRKSKVIVQPKKTFQDDNVEKLR